jgi:hypothetical protein
MDKSFGLRWFERALFGGAVALLIWSIVERSYRPDSLWGSNSSILLNVALVFLTALNFVRNGSMRAVMMTATSIALIAHFFAR